MRDPHDRRCFQCGHVQHCIDRVIPEVTCRNCGSNDTRAVIPQPPSELQHLRDRIETMNELFADIRKAVGGNPFCQELHPEDFDPESPWLPVGLLLRIDAAMNREHRG